MARSIQPHYPFDQRKDSGRLQFEDDTFDYALIPIALHQLQAVYRGVYEATRISKMGVILLESYDSPLARLATRFRVATEYEEVGNYVFRVTIKEMVKIGKAMFMEVCAQLYMCIHYTARNSIEYAAWCGMNRVANITAPLVANECIVYFRKQTWVQP